MLSQGVPFIHAGQEFFRTKDKDENSYQSSDAINKLDWERYAENIDSVQDIEAVMQLRNSEPLFRLTNYADINQKMKIIKQDENVVAYELKDGDTSYVVAFNANKAEKEIAIPANKYWARIGETTTNLTAETSTVKVGALSTIVLKNGTATFEIEASAGVGGTITPNGKQTYAAGEKPSYTVKADTGYRLQQVLVDGKAVTLSGNMYRFESLAASHKVEAIFEVIPRENKLESLDKITLPVAELMVQPGQSAKEFYLLQKLAARGYYQMEGETEQHDLDITLAVTNLDWEAPKAGTYEGTVQLTSEMRSRAVTTKSVQITLTAAAPAPGGGEVTKPVKPTTPSGPVGGNTTTVPPKKETNISVNKTDENPVKVTPTEALPATGDSNSSLLFFAWSNLYQR
ncbi:pullulanase [Listeria rocourtiae FSL F6-920]|nr:pullulanase [Listeria rocourtiae FSL F6-920]